MAHPHKSEHDDTEKRSIERLDLPTAGALSGEGRLQKMKLHEDQGDNPPDEPVGSEDSEHEAEEAEGEEE